MARHTANTDFVTLKWHDLARHIAGHCWNKIRVSVRLALDFSELESYSSSRYMTSVRRSTRKTRVQICEYIQLYSLFKEQQPQNN